MEQTKLPKYVFVTFKKVNGQVKAVLANLFKLSEESQLSNFKRHVVDFDCNNLTEVDYKEVLGLAKQGEVYGFPEDMSKFNPRDFILQRNELRIVIDLSSITEMVHYIVFVDYLGHLYILPILVFKYLIDTGAYVLKNSTIKYVANLTIRSKYQKLSYSKLRESRGALLHHDIFPKNDFADLFLSYIERIEDSFNAFGIPTIVELTEPKIVLNFTSYFDDLAGIIRIIKFTGDSIKAHTPEYEQTYANYSESRKHYSDTPEVYEKGLLNKLSENVYNIVKAFFFSSIPTEIRESEFMGDLTSRLIMEIQGLNLNHMANEYFPIRFYDSDKDKHRLPLLIIGKHGYFGEFQHKKVMRNTSVDISYSKRTDEFSIPFTVAGLLKKNTFDCILRISLDDPDKFRVENVEFDTDDVLDHTLFDKPTYEEFLHKAGIYTSWDTEGSTCFTTRPYGTDGFVVSDVKSFAEGNLDSLKALLRQFGVTMRQGKGCDDLFYVTTRVGQFPNDIVFEIQNHIVRNTDTKKPAKLQVYQRGKLQQSIFIDEDYATSDTLNPPLTSIMGLVNDIQAGTNYSLGYNAKYALEDLFSSNDTKSFLREPYPKECFKELSKGSAKKLNIGIFMPLQLPVLYLQLDSVRWYADTSYHYSNDDTYDVFSTCLIICACGEIKKLKEIQSSLTFSKTYLLPDRVKDEYIHYDEEEFLYTEREQGFSTDTGHMSYIIGRRIVGWDVDFTLLFPELAKQGKLDGVIY